MNLYAWIAKDDDGKEYLITWDVGKGKLPLVGPDKKLVESGKPVALLHQERTGHKVRMVSFVERKSWMR